MSEKDKGVSRASSRAPSRASLKLNDISPQKRRSRSDSEKSNRTTYSFRSESKKRKRSKESRVSRTSTAITDVEDSDLYLKIKKLKKDKKALKHRLKEIELRVEEKIKDYKNNITEIRNTYQEQLDDVSKERDKAVREVDRLRDELLDHQENTVKVLDKQKTEIQKKYDSQIVKRLEDTIVKLQQRLTKQLEEREKIKNQTEEYFQNKEKIYLEKLGEFENQKSCIRDEYIQELERLQKIIKGQNDVKEQDLNLLRKQKNEEMKNIVSEFTGKVSALESQKQYLEKTVKELTKQTELALNDSKGYVDSIKYDYERKEKDLLLMVENNKKQYNLEIEAKISEAERVKRIELDTLKSEYEKKIEILVFENNRKFSTVTQELNEEIKNLKDVNSSILNRTSNLAEFQENYKKLEEQNKKLSLDFSSEKGKLESKLNDKEKELRDLKLRKEKEVGELQDINSRLKEQLEQISLNFKKLQETTNNLSSQFILNINKQKETLEKQIQDKEQIIQESKRHISRLESEAMEKLNTFERKININQEEKKEFLTKIEKLKEETISLEKENVSLRDEHKKQFGVFIQQEETIKKILLEKELYEKRLKMTEVSLANREEEFKRLKTEFSRFSNFDKDFVDSKLKSVHEMGSLKTDLIYAQKQVETLTNDKNLLQEEINKTKISLEALRIRELDNQKKEHNKVLGELGAKIQLSEKKQRELENEKIRLNTELIGACFDRDKYKKQYDSTFTELTNLNKIYSDLQRESELIKMNYVNAMKDIQNKDKEIIQYKQQGVLLKLKDGQLNTLATQLSSLQQTHRHTIDKISNEHKKEKEELRKLRDSEAKNLEKLKEYPDLKSRLETLEKDRNISLLRLEAEKDKEIMSLKKKVSELEVRALHHSQEVEKLRFEFLQREHVLRQLPPEERKQLEETLKENEKLKNQLELVENNLNKLQIKEASLIGENNARIKYIEEKEKKLQMLEEKLSNEPPKLLDPHLREELENTKLQLRQAKNECARYKEEIALLKGKDL